MKAKITSILKYDWIGQGFFWHLKPTSQYTIWATKIVNVK